MTPATRRTLAAVCNHLSVDVDRVRAGSQLRACVIARSVAMYVMRQYYKPRPSLVELGLDFGRDHSTVISALARVEMRKHDEFVIGAIEVGRQALERTRKQMTMLAKRRELDEARVRVAELERELGEDGAVAAE